MTVFDFDEQLLSCYASLLMLYESDGGGSGNFVCADPRRAEKL